MSQTSHDSPFVPFQQTDEFKLIGRALVQLPANDPARNAAVRALYQISEAYDRKMKILGLVKEAMAQLRLDIKYMTFDIESTQRERDEYRRRLEG